MTRTVWLFLVLCTGGAGAVAYLFAGPPARLGRAFGECVRFTEVPRGDRTSRMV